MPKSEEGVPNISDLKQVFLTASIYAEENRDVDSSGFVEFDELWALLENDVRTHLIETNFSYFPLRIKPAQISPFIIVRLQKASLIMFSDGSVKLDRKEHTKGGQEGVIAPSKAQTERTKHM